MSGSYRPRPTEVKTCLHCGTPFETRHKRAMYCGSSCRVLAFNARHGIESEKTGKAKGDLALSAQNVGVTSLGAGLAAVGNYVFNDQPAQKKILAKLVALDKDVELGLNRILTVSQEQLYFMEAMKLLHPGLQDYMNQERQKYQLEADKGQARKRLEAALSTKKKTQ